MTILLVLSVCLDFLLAGCRAKKELKASERREQTSEIGVELRRVDSLWSSIAERKTVRIEFYPQTDIQATRQGLNGSKNCPEAAPCLANHPIDSCPRASRDGNEGWLGAVKSIEVTTESGTSTGAVAAVDSTLQAEKHSAETRQTEKASVLRHDNGTVLIVSVVAGVVLLLALIIIIKKIFHK